MTYLQSKNRLTDNREQTYDCQGGGSVGEERTTRCKLLYTGWTNSKLPLCSIENYIRYLVLNHNGKEYMSIIVSLLLYGRS